MKLYTEEQVKSLVHQCRIYNVPAERFLFNYTPIALPSDEDIEEYLKSFPYTKHLDDGQYNDGVIVGAELAIEWFRDKIK